MSIPTQPKPYGIYTPPSLMQLETTYAAAAAASLHARCLRQRHHRPISLKP